MAPAPSSPTPERNIKPASTTREPRTHPESPLGSFARPHIRNEPVNRYASLKRSHAACLLVPKASPISVHEHPDSLARRTWSRNTFSSACSTPRASRTPSSGCCPQSPASRTLIEAPSPTTFKRLSVPTPPPPSSGNPDDPICRSPAWTGVPVIPSITRDRKPGSLRDHAPRFRPLRRSGASPRGAVSGAANPASATATPKPARAYATWAQPRRSL